MKFKILIVAFLFTAFSGYAQLPAFTLQVTTTDETCDGNGTLTLAPAGLSVGSQLLFSLYKLPNVTTPLNQFSQLTLGGLQSGNYRIVASQTLGTLANSVQKDFTIADQVVPLTFGVTPSTASGCSVSGNLTVNVTSGHGPFFYEITQGPVTKLPQTSNVLPGLTAGLYRVRVIDGCGTIAVLDYTLALTANNLSISATQNPVVANSCTDIDVLNTITASSGTLVYPLSVVYTIHNPVTGNQVVTQQYPTGPADALPLSLNLPIIANTPYAYDLVISDSCNSFTSTGTVDASPQVSMTGTPTPCGGEFLTLSVTNFSPPYTVNFVQMPTGFVPSDFNAAHPGPFTTASVDYGTDNHTVPEGFYKVQVTDACGHIGIMKDPYEVKEIPLVPIKEITNASCTSPVGRIKLSIPESRKIVSAILTLAPAAYPNATPFDVSSLINATDGSLTLTNLPIGNYTITLIDSCSESYIDVPFLIQPFQPQGLSALAKPSCVTDLGSVRVRSGNGNLVSVSITAAPPAFTGTLPMDLSANLLNGVLYMTDLPAGNYTFSGMDACNFTNATTVLVAGYDPGVNNYTMIPHCGSFDVALNDHSNVIGTSYWLQKLVDPANNIWGHPQTNAPYTENTDPVDANSLQIANGSTLLNQTQHGTFRIVKVFQTYQSGTGNCRLALEPTFSFSGDLDVTGAYTLDCIGGSGPSSVYIDVQGVPPYHFTIESKDGVSFPFDNGSSNIFNNLAPGLYVFKVTDSCTRSKNPTVNVGTLLPLVKANDPLPGELVSCLDGTVTTDQFDLTTLNPQILGNQAPENYVVTYHLTQAEADSGANPLPELYTNVTNPQTIYVRVVHKTIGICYDTTSFKLYVGKKPVLNPNQDPIYVCDGGFVRLFADPGFTNYLWSNGVTRPFIDVTEPGVYSVTVSNIYGSTTCGTTKDITVQGSSIGTITSIDTADWTDNHNSITVNVSGSGDWRYSLDGTNYQTSNVFEGLVPGVYHVFVKDAHGCGIVEGEVSLLNYPTFFTPNADGYNDYWQIKFAATEPHMTIIIFDRYGKIVAGFDSESRGWDGNYNGEPLPSTDYWFKVERADGSIHRGHFAMKR